MRRRMTEAEAAGVWCPASGMRSAAGETTWTRCLGPKCAVWEPEPGVVSVDPKAGTAMSSPGQGFCGLGGRS